MSLEQTACEGSLKIYIYTARIIVTSKLDVIADLKAFERRLTEVIASLQPSTIRWRSIKNNFTQ